MSHIEMLLDDCSLQLDVYRSRVRCDPDVSVCVHTMRVVRRDSRTRKREEGHQLEVKHDFVCTNDGKFPALHKVSR